MIRTGANSLLSFVCHKAICFLVVLLSVAATSSAQDEHTAVKDDASTAIKRVVIHPVHDLKYKTNDHYYGQFKGALGDELGMDVTIVQYDGGPAGRFPAFYKNDGTANEDWYGWDQRVLAPFSGKVTKVHVNPQVNKPGNRGEGPASFIEFERGDGVKVVYAHVQNIRVKVGDSVEAGQFVARVGNNGFAWMPHVHIGAWQGNRPLQVVFDLKALGALYNKK